jgi:hypothetical protein
MRQPLEDGKATIFAGGEFTHVSRGSKKIATGSSILQSKRTQSSPAAGERLKSRRLERDVPLFRKTLEFKRLHDPL